MALNGIPAFPIHSAKFRPGIGPKFLSKYEFAVIIFAASGVSASSRRIGTARITAAVEWSGKGKKSIVHKD